MATHQLLDGSGRGWFFFAVAMAFPSILQGVLGAADAEFGVETRSALGVAASLMLGWTFLLIWADGKPLERKGVLAITVFPVIAGLGITTFFGYYVDYIPLAGAVRIWILLILLILLLSFSYVSASRRTG